MVSIAVNDGAEVEASIRSGVGPSEAACKLRGYIDGITPTGYIEGWALDEDKPAHPLEIKIRCENAWIASGISHLFRDDLQTARIGTGWCHFRLRTDFSIETIRRSTLYLADSAERVFAHFEAITLIPELNEDLRTIEDVIATDPTIVRSIECLRGCEDVFTRYMRMRGIDAFVRAAYVYILGRPVDEAGLRVYGGRLRRGTHVPFELLQILAGSEEFVSRRPELAAPTQTSFPFRVD